MILFVLELTGMILLVSVEGDVAEKERDRCICRSFEAFENL